MLLVVTAVEVASGIKGADSVPPPQEEEETAEEGAVGVAEEIAEEAEAKATS